MSARNVHGCHVSNESNGPSRSQWPDRALAIDEPVTTMPIANSTTPIARTTGITSGDFTSRVATSRITPNTNAGSHSFSSSPWNRSPIGVRYGDSSEET